MANGIMLNLDNSIKAVFAKKYIYFQAGSSISRTHSNKFLHFYEGENGLQSLSANYFKQSKFFLSCYCYVLNIFV